MLESTRITENTAPTIGVAILGSTGSIGTQALDVIRSQPERYRVTTLAIDKNIELLRQQIQEFRPARVAVRSQAAAEQLRLDLPKGVALHIGEQGFDEIYEAEDTHIALVAVVGFAGFRCVMSAIDAGLHIALANKESLVAGGEHVLANAKRKNVSIVPVDSEHSSIYQCLQHRHRKEDIQRIVLTASGGPFYFNRNISLENVTPQQAVNHPRWAMGAKISVDSATLVNKGLEVIEAARLFEVSAEKIGVYIHPQSIVHGLAEFCDGTVLASMYETDMRIPISYAFTTLRNQLFGDSAGKRPDIAKNLMLNLAQKEPLEFFEPDLNRFPGLALAFDALRKGGVIPTVFNAANEIAVQEFLACRLPFLGIPKVIADVMERYCGQCNPVDTRDVEAVDVYARSIARECLVRL